MRILSAEATPEAMPALHRACVCLVAKALCHVRDLSRGEIESDGVRLV